MDEARDHWTAIGHTSNQLILYHPPSHALAVQPHPIKPVAGPSRPPTRPLLLPYRSASPAPAPLQRLCPTCSQPLPKADLPTGVETPTQVGQAGRGYFQILEEAHEGSRPPSPSPRRGGRRRSLTPTPTPAPLSEDEDALDDGDLPARGYYDRYFREEGRLGMGAEGSVFLATHVIGGNVLGTYAVKKIAVGRSKAYLVKMLREVRLLEALRHPNIIPYHHSWVDTTQFSNFGPPIAALHVLMMYATAGNLDTYLLNRSNSPNPGGQDLSAGNIADAESLGQLPKEERIKAFKKRRQSSTATAGPGGAGVRRKREENRGVLMLGLEEIGKLFGDVVEGLAFLHANSILHLDLKCSNVLLHWEEGKLIPKALLSDFGTSEEMLKGRRERTGHTGTMEYMAPETLVTDVNGHWRPSDSHADIWSLGLILYKLLFLHLPYPDTDDYPALLQEIVRYPGFIPTSEMYAACERRHIPRDLLLLLSKLIHVKPESRPSAERVKAGMRDLESQARATSRAGVSGGLVARVQRFGRGMADLVTPPPPSSDDTSIQPWKSLPPGFSSPVQSILALPSPEDERAETPIAAPRPYLTGAQNRVKPIVSASQVRFALAALQILSLHLMAFGERSGKTSVALIIAALVEIRVDRWSLTLPVTGMYLAALGSLLWVGSSGTDTQHAAQNLAIVDEYEL